MQFIMREPRKSKVSRYAARMTEIDKYLAILTVSKESNRIIGIELNVILMYITPKGLIRQAYMQEFVF